MKFGMGKGIVETSFNQFRIVIDVSHTFRSGYQTGIQRVVREFVDNVEKKSDYHLAWFPNFLESYFIELKQSDILGNQSRNPNTRFKNTLDNYTLKILSKFSSLRTIAVNVYEILLFAKLLLRPDRYRLRKITKSDKLLLIDAFWADPRFQKKLERFENLDLKIFFFVHDLFPISNPEWFNERQVAQFSKSVEKAFQVSHTVICSSEFVKSEVLKLFASQIKHVDSLQRVKLACSNYAVETDRVERHGIVVLGTIEPRKNINLILDWIEAFSPEENVWIIGRRGWESSETFNRINKLVLMGKVIWLENASDQEVAFHLARRRVGILASEAEGFGLPILEYSRFGLHILARDIPAFREINSAGALYFTSTNDLQKCYLGTIGRPQPPFYQSDYSWRSFTLKILGIIELADK
jgi:glycosyltransferase involved in cell wall biosynthesis